MKITEIITESVKQRLDPKCWKGKHKEGTKIKGGVRVNNCVPNESINEYGDTAKGQKMLTKVQKRAVDRVTSKKADTDPKYAKKNSDTANRAWERMDDKDLEEAANPAQQAAIAVNMKKKHQKPKSLEEQFDMIEEMVETLAEQYNVDSEAIWEYFESVDDNTLLETAAWQRKEGKSKTGGLNKKGVASYRREHPGSKLQTAVTTKPSKLKPGSKAAKRRKSFCARMSGMKGPMKDKHGKPTRKALSLRKWNC